MASSKPTLGVNDLQSQFPDIAAEAYGWDPSTVALGTDKAKKWICRSGHIWDTSPNNRTSQNSGCPICSNKKILTGFNDLKTKFRK